MDRWSERDDDDIRQKGPQGRVAREGIGAFVKQGKGTISHVRLTCTFHVPYMTGLVQDV